MTHPPLVVMGDDIAAALGVSGATYRSFATLSRPRDLPFVGLPGKHKNRFKGFLLAPVLEWLRRAAPDHATEEFEARLFSRAMKNQEKFTDV